LGLRARDASQHYQRARNNKQLSHALSPKRRARYLA
jgi:hypothetical protein